jgi:histidinol-phosphate phosphatase family protein
MKKRSPAAGRTSSFITHPSDFRKAVFLDRDDTIIGDMEFSIDLAKLSLLPGAVEALRRLQEAGYLLIIVTNQSGVARGRFSEEALRGFHEHFLRRLERSGVRFAGIYYCPHYAEGKVVEYSFTCDCRKPEPGLLLRAARELGVDLKKSWMVGDRPADIGAGRAAGCRTIRVGDADWGESDPRADFDTPDLVRAAEIILRKDDGR